MHGINVEIPPYVHGGRLPPLPLFAHILYGQPYVPVPVRNILAVCVFCVGNGNSDADMTKNTSLDNTATASAWNDDTNLQTDLRKSKSVRKLSHPKKFVCCVCGKSFTCSSDLKRHTRCHTKERPYACGLCEKTFKQTSTFYQHMRKFHPGVPYARLSETSSATRLTSGEYVLIRFRQFL